MVILSDCAECKNFMPDKNTLKCICKAYPNGIPKEWFLKGEPRKVKECHNEIGFEQANN